MDICNILAFILHTKANIRMRFMFQTRYEDEKLSYKQQKTLNVSMRLLYLSPHLK